ncbi:hypothetical protein SUGI_0191040 [Cryptomeria japonica]|uniref:NAC domain-containing protein 6 n=1 Tax=Cryptomeria japonica TaxID=3369 RepID=UPI002408A21A|nr:NAC domain-containing protein 6 [Cryptomeria japonica]GLJ12452.1 hypothetical protein SUGI_0191040 [Cryptomeria japonica]
MKTEMGIGEQKGRDMGEFELPGFRFHPTEQELVGFYLKKMVQGKLHNFSYIGVLDLYQYDPWDLPSLGRLGERELFFFVPRDKKCQNGGRPSRITACGYWKATGSDRHVRDEYGKALGLKKTLVFYRGRAPRGEKTDWIMNEYRMLDSNERYRKEVVLCRIYRKATPLKWLEQKAISQAQETSMDEDFESKPEEDTFVSSRQTSSDVQANKQVSSKSKQPQQSSSLDDNTNTTHTNSDITSSQGCCSALDLELNSMMESTVYGGYIDPIFQAFADDGKKSMEGFSSLMAMINSTSIDCCGLDSIFPSPDTQKSKVVDMPKLSLDFRNDGSLSTGKDKSPWADLWSPSIFLSTPNNHQLDGF